MSKTTVEANNLPFLCSIVITNYNYATYVTRAIDSAISQGYKNKEIIIVDDGSTDNSVEVINNHLAALDEETRKNIQLITKQNGGTASARNAGIQASKGQFIAFLDADDFYLPDKVSISIMKLIEFPGLGVAYTDYGQINKDNTKVRQFKAPFDAIKLSSYCMVSTNSILKREVFEKVGLFNEQIKGMEDYEFWMRASSAFAFCHIPFPLFVYHEHGNNKTFTMSREAWQAEEKLIKGN